MVRLANDAMDKGMGRGARSSCPAQNVVQPLPTQEFEGAVRDGGVELVKGTLPEGCRLQVRVKR